VVDRNNDVVRTLVSRGLIEEVDDETWQPTVYDPTPAITDQWGTGRIITGNVPHAEMSPDKGLWQVPA